MSVTDPWPKAITYDSAQKILRMTFETGEQFDLPAEYLRVESPSAEVQGHHPSQKVLVAGRRHVGIRDIEPVGNYAIRLIFDDLHDSGIYSWRFLHALGREYETRWSDYLAALAGKGLARDP